MPPGDSTSDRAVRRARRDDINVTEEGPLCQLHGKKTHIHSSLLANLSVTHTHTEDV